MGAIARAGRKSVALEFLGCVFVLRHRFSVKNWLPYCSIVNCTGLLGNENKILWHVDLAVSRLQEQIKLLSVYFSRLGRLSMNESWIRCGRLSCSRPGCMFSIDSKNTRHFHLKVLLSSQLASPDFNQYL